MTRWFAVGMCSCLPQLSWSAEPITILTEHLPPYQINIDGEAAGFATELVKLTFTDATIDYKIQFASWSRAYQLALRTANTCIYSMSRSKERETLFHWIGELSYNTTALYTFGAREDIHLNNLADAKAYVIAVTRDDITHHYLKAQGFAEGKNLYVLDGIANALPLMSARGEEIDLIIVNDTILKYRASEANLPPKAFRQVLVLPDLPLDFHLACSKKTPLNVVQKLQQSLANIKKDGRFAKITSQWSEKLTPLPPSM